MTKPTDRCRECGKEYGVEKANAMNLGSKKFLVFVKWLGLFGVIGISVGLVLQEILNPEGSLYYIAGLGLGMALGCIYGNVRIEKISIIEE